MCWSGEASFTLATAGFIGAAVAAYRGDPVWRWAPLVYFSTMETLQGFTYGWIGQCGVEANYWLTVASYLHICFQPFFANMFNLSFFTREEQRQAWWIWPASGIASLTMLTMFLLPNWPAHCIPGAQNLCGMMTCSYHGNWHIAWAVDLSNLDPHFWTYWLAVFILPLFYRGWKFVLYHILLGPILASTLTNDLNEMPAIWCLLSIGFLLATHLQPINRWIHSPKARREEESRVKGEKVE